MMNKDEAVQKLSKVGRLSMSYAEDLYDSFFEKPVVPQYVADWYEKVKDSFNYDLIKDINSIPTPIDGVEFTDFEKWILDNNESLTTLVNMHQFGYEIEKEVRYTVRIKGIDDRYDVLNHGTHLDEWTIDDAEGTEGVRTTHTRKELEANGFGWVFDCPGVEVKEVE